MAHCPLQDKGLQGSQALWPPPTLLAFLLTLAVASMQAVAHMRVSAHGLPLPKMPNFPSAPIHLQR